MDVGQKIVEGFSRARTIRANGYDARFNKAARYLNPEDGHFSDTNRNIGHSDRSHLFYNKPALLVEKFVSVLEYLITPTGTMWHKLDLEDEGFEDDKTVQIWLDRLTKSLFRYRYRGSAGFTAARLATYTEIGRYGNGVIFVDEDKQGLPKYLSIPLYQIFLGKGWGGDADTVYRFFMPTIRQCWERFGRDALPAALNQRGDKDAEQTVEVVHCVLPNAEAVINSKLPQEAPFTSYYILLENSNVLETKPQYSMPYCVGQLRTSAGEIYAKSPANIVLDDISSLNQLSKNILINSNMASSPPILIHGAHDANRFSLKAGAINRGMVSPEGRPLAVALQGVTNPSAGIDFLEWVERRVKEAFMLDMFEILIEKSNMTLGEVMERKGERAAFLSTGLGDLPNMYSSMIDREIDILNRSGKLAPPPPNLVKALGEKANVSVVYDNELARLQRAGQQGAQQRWFQETLMYAQVNPSVTSMVNLEQMVKNSHEANGLEARLLYSDEEVEKAKQAEAEQKQMQQLLEAAPQAASAIKDLSQAGQI